MLLWKTNLGDDPTNTSTETILTSVPISVVVDIEKVLEETTTTLTDVVVTEMGEVTLTSQTLTNTE